MRPDEEERIAGLLRHAHTPLPPGMIGPGDDAAVLKVPKGHSVVVSTDLVAEGVHFFAGADPELIGRFVVTVNLSDIAAMGAAPVGFLVAYGVPPDREADWLDAVGRGVAAALDAVACPLIGGDTKEAARPVVVGTALGHVRDGGAVTRRGASSGDVLVLTGAVGGPAAALHAHGQRRMEADRVMRVVLGRPSRLEAGGVLAAAGATAMVDLSDGLARAAHLIAVGSGVALRLESARIPIDPLVRREVDPQTWADHPLGRRIVLGVGGEYELLAAIPERHLEGALEGLRQLGLHPRSIGACTEGRGASLATTEGEVSLDALGWRHFA